MNALSGKRILITRPRSQAADLEVLLEAEGARVILFPTIEIAPLDDTTRLDTALGDLAAGVYNWVIFTSVNGVEACRQQIARTGGSVPQIFTSARVAAIGPSTARALQALGIRVEFVPQEYVAERILDGLGQVAGQRILLPRAEIARPALAEALAQSGAQVDEIPVYHTLQAQPDPAGLAALREGVDMILFTSSSTVRNYVALTDGQTGQARVACIGPITAGTARELGLAVDITAREYSMPGLVKALKEYYDDTKSA